jgi:hypothetical protein
MKYVQRFVTAVCPKDWGELMRADSERWKYRCLTCGASRSMWDAGEIRWNVNTVGQRTFKWCPTCRWLRWSELKYHDEEPSSSRPDQKPVNGEKTISQSAPSRSSAECTVSRSG